MPSRAGSHDGRPPLPERDRDTAHCVGVHMNRSDRLLSRLVLVASLAGVVAAGACSSDGARTVGPAAPELALSQGARLSGTAIITVQTLDPARQRFARSSDTAAFSATVQEGKRTIATLALAGGNSVPLVLAVDDRIHRRQGSWRTRTAPRGGAVASMEFEARGGAPVSRATAVVNGQVVSRTEDSWLRARNGWLLTRRTITLFRDGAQVGTVEIAVNVDHHQLADAGVTRGSDAMRVVADALRPIGRLAAAALLPAPLGAQTDCTSEVRAAEDALADYIKSVALFAISIWAGPVGTVAGGVNLLAAGYRVEVTQLRLDECVAGI